MTVIRDGRDALHVEGANPYPVLDVEGHIRGWRWYDEAGIPCERMFPSQRAALAALMKYVDYMEGGMKWHQRVWFHLKRLWKDESTGRY